jgi:hypothetical protein
MLLGMPFLVATNPEIDWTKGIFPGDIQAATPGAVIKGAIIAATRDAQEWTPHSRSKPLTYSEPPEGYDHYKAPYSSMSSQKTTRLSDALPKPLLWQQKQQIKRNAPGKNKFLWNTTHMAKYSAKRHRTDSQDRVHGIMP